MQGEGLVNCILSQRPPVTCLLLATIMEAQTAQERMAMFTPPSQRHKPADHAFISPPNSPTHGSSMVVMEQRMREQIRMLQEQRAAAMMDEVIDLQRERDLALGRLKALKKSMEDLTMENALLKGAVGKRDLTDKLLFLERSYVEEQLLSNDLRKKLQTANKQNESLQLKVRKLEMEAGAKQALDSPRLSVELVQRERSNSLDSRQIERASCIKTPAQASSTSETSTSTTRLPPKGMKSSPPLLSASSSQLTPSTGVRSGSNTPLSYSPAVIPRRYKLAAAICRDIGTQTFPRESSADKGNTEQEEDKSLDEVPTDILAVLETAKKDILTLQQEKECLEVSLSDERVYRAKDKENLQNLKKEYALLKTECSVLKGSLSEFSLWTRQKIQLFEEDMDIFKVVYSLHGSLSQEKAMLNDLREKLSKAESKITRLESANGQLKDEVMLVEEKYNQCKRDIKRLREKRPNNTMSPESSSPPYYHSPKQHRHTVHGSPSLRPYKSVGHNMQSSPLLSRTSPPLKAMFPVKVANREHDVV